MAEPIARAPDFYCDEVLSGRTPVHVVVETENVLAFHHTHPGWPFHVAVIPKRHVASLVALEASDAALIAEMIGVIRQVAEMALAERGGCRVMTNLGEWQTNKHLHWHVYSDSPAR